MSPLLIHPVAVAAAVLLWLGVAVLLLSCVGAVAARDVRDRLHHVALAAVVGAPLVALSLALTAGSWRSGLKLLLIAGLLIATAPATSAATARAFGPARDADSAEDR